MSSVADQIAAVWPALAFLLGGVPLAALLDRLGFFEAVAIVIGGRDRPIPVLALWSLAATTTVVLNLDTTVVLLTPLFFRLARRADTDPVPLVAVTLLLASLASSVLPVSNLTTLIVVDRFHLGVGDVASHLALPSLAATVVGYGAYRRRHPARIPSGPPAQPDRRALLVGGPIVAGVLAGFVLGPPLGIAPWVIALLADVALMFITRFVPWRHVPVPTAGAIAGLAVVVALLVPSDAFTALLGHSSPSALIGVVAVATAAANVVNNLPAVLVALDGIHHMSWGMWAWLLGVNTGAALLPVGAVANLLWLRVNREEGLAMGVRRYVGITVPVALPALAAAAVVLAAERAWLF